MVNNGKDVELEMEPTVQSAAQQPPKRIHHRNALSPLLGRQSSVYSLTLDEFQHTLIGSGKNFGSMNMEEFITSIFAAEEHAQSQPQPQSLPRPSPFPATASHRSQLFSGQGSGSSAVPKQNSIAIPSLLSRKTVEEVWEEILKTHPQQNEAGSHIGNSNSTQKQLTFGEITLDNFLTKAGVVRELSPPSVQIPVPVSVPTPLTWYKNNINTSPVPTYVSKPTMILDGLGNVPPYQNLSHGGLVSTPDASSIGYAGNRKSGCVGGYPPVSPYNMGGLGIVPPISAPPMPMPISPDSSDIGMGGNQLVGRSNGRTRGGRKRNIDGSVEKVVERRQRRMIKNRESAARSRARKQAYTVELETELNLVKEENSQLKEEHSQLKEENSQLKQALLGLNNTYLEELRAEASQNNELNNMEKLRLMQRSISAPL